MRVVASFPALVVVALLGASLLIAARVQPSAFSMPKDSRCSINVFVASRLLNQR